MARTHSHPDRMSAPDLQRDFTTALQFQLTRNWPEAEQCYRDLIERAPTEPILSYNLGLVLKAQGKWVAAIDAFRVALRLKPNFPEAVNNLATTLTTVGEPDEAIELLESCTRENPQFAEAFNNLGDAYKDRGEIELAVRALELATARRPDRAVFRSNLIYAQHYHPSSTPETLRDAAEKWARDFSPNQAPRIDSSIHPGRKRIGYVGAFFRRHCQSLFLLPLLSHHDRTRYEIFCYSDDAAADEVTARLCGYSDHWRNIAGQTSAEIAERIRGDALDVLIDLGLHTAQNYLSVFALKPAPRQISWLGYPGTTGLKTIDARLTDPYLDPPGQHDGDYTERSIRLPHTFWCYDPHALDEQIVPSGPHLMRSGITFGCLNNFCKVNDGVLAMWARVLAEVPAAHFILMAPRGRARVRVRRELGIAEDRLTFVEFAPREVYLERYRSIDICLDTYPYNGHTTSLDALWMGVPVVTLCGRTAVSRAGYSLLANVGLTDLVASSAAEFVRIARELAHDRERLGQLHAMLRSRVEKSPLMDAVRFARDFEHALFTER